MRFTEFNPALLEINMGQTNLRSEAAKIGAIAGMEFEMIVAAAAHEYSDEMEPDYDFDEHASSIENVIEFFSDNYYNQRSTVARVEEEMRDDYHSWLNDFIYDSWRRDELQELMEYTRLYVFDIDEFITNAKEANPDLDDDDIRVMMEDKLEELATDEMEMSPKSEVYDAAFEEYSNHMMPLYPVEDWFRANGLRDMSDFENRYNLTWPHYSDGSAGDGPDIHNIASDFESAIGRPVRVNTYYHDRSSARQIPGDTFYIVEPDSSLEPDSSSSGDLGLEFVSPPLPIAKLLVDLDKIKKWAEITDNYTNRSTGLHINISVPGFTNDRLDYVKLALLLGDEYILNSFGRASSEYAKSAFTIIKQNVAARPADAVALLTKMKSNLSTLAASVIHSGNTNKNVSINTKEGYIEFRAPGGDWLGENFDKIEITLLRMVVALDASINEDKYKEEYAKKLYKLLARSSDDTNTIEYFTKFAAGGMPRSALKSFIRQAQLQRKTGKKATVIEPPANANHAVFNNGTGELLPNGRFYAATLDDARAEFRRVLQANGIDSPGGYGYRMIEPAAGNGERVVQPSTNMSISPDTWEIYNRQSGEVVHSFVNTNGQPAAWDQARNWIVGSTFNASDYSVRQQGMPSLI
jgi:hypothetical protein